MFQIEFLSLGALLVKESGRSAIWNYGRYCSYVCDNDKSVKAVGPTNDTV